MEISFHHARDGELQLLYQPVKHGIILQLEESIENGCETAVHIITVSWWSDPTCATMCAWV